MNRVKKLGGRGGAGVGGRAAGGDGAQDGPAAGPLRDLLHGGRAHAAQRPPPRSEPPDAGDAAGADRNATMRFRFQSLLQRWVLMTTYWNRTMREIEMGTYRRDLDKAHRHLAARAARRSPRTRPCGWASPPTGSRPSSAASSASRARRRSPGRSPAGRRHRSSTPAAAARAGRRRRGVARDCATGALEDFYAALRRRPTARCGRAAQGHPRTDARQAAAGPAQAPRPSRTAAAWSWTSPSRAARSGCAPGRCSKRAGSPQASG